MSERLIIFAKIPRPGYCKTRLVPPLTNEQAAALHQACLDDALELATGFDSVLYVAGGKNYQAIIPEQAQQGADLGARMNHALTTELQAYDKAILIGCDIPQLSPALLRQAFAVLDNADLVIGPATDGGYYLIGMKTPQPKLFAGISWGSAQTLPQTLKKAQGQKLKYKLLPCLADMDVWRDVVAVKDFLAEDSRLQRFLSQLLQQ